MRREWLSTHLLVLGASVFIFATGDDSLSLPATTRQHTAQQRPHLSPSSGERVPRRREVDVAAVLGALNGGEDKREPTPTEEEGGHPDDPLYSRQEFTLGQKAQSRISAASVLISGMSGAGAEIAKNLVLAGIGRVTLHDDGPAEYSDLSSNFALSEKHVRGQVPRAEACAEVLRHMNPRVDVEVVSGKIDEELLEEHELLILVNAEWEEQLRLSDLCSRLRGEAGDAGERESRSGDVEGETTSKEASTATDGLPQIPGETSKSPSLIVVENRGLVMSLFVDLGDTFVVSDATGGEAPSPLRITRVELGIDEGKTPPSLILHFGDPDGGDPAWDGGSTGGPLSKRTHSLQDGQGIVLRNFVSPSLSWLNGETAREVQVVSPSAVRIALQEKGSKAKLVEKLAAEVQQKGHVDYKGGASALEVRRPLVLSFDRLGAVCGSPQGAAFKEALVPSDFTKMDRAPSLSACIQALHEVEKENKMRTGSSSFFSFPLGQRSSKSIEKMILRRARRRALRQHTVSPSRDQWKEGVAKQAVQSFAQGGGGISPMATLAGGLAAQEALKAVSGTLRPLQQLLFFDALEALPPPDAADESNVIGLLRFLSRCLGYPLRFLGCQLRRLRRGNLFGVQEDRYSGQRRVLGSRLQRQLQDLNLFVVGAGAIGCELLKCLAGMGVSSADPSARGGRGGGKGVVGAVKGTWAKGGREEHERGSLSGGGGGGCIWLTDMDSVERSNLSRQLLFRESDIGRLKAEAAAESIPELNPLTNVRWMAVKVERATEGEGPGKLSDDFWGSQIDVVMNALDNVQARLFVDSRCVRHWVPLLESGTRGVQGSTQVVLPGVSESYATTRDPEEESVPICTVKSFPTETAHVVQWARDVFHGLFFEGPRLGNSFCLHPPTAVREIAAMDLEEMVRSLRDLLDFLSLPAAEDSEEEGEAGEMKGEGRMPVGGDTMEQEEEGEGQGEENIRDNDAEGQRSWAIRLFNTLFKESVERLGERLEADELLEKSSKFGAPVAICFKSGEENHEAFVSAALAVRGSARLPSPLPSSALHHLSSLSPDAEDLEETVFAEIAEAREVFLEELRQRGREERHREGRSTRGEKEDEERAHIAEAQRLLNELLSRPVVLNRLVAARRLAMSSRLPEKEREVEFHFASSQQADGPPASFAPFSPLEFDKDDRATAALEFICQATFLRSANYHIVPASRMEIKRIAGNIVPAIATATAVVAALSCLELLKLVSLGFVQKKRRETRRGRQRQKDRHQFFDERLRWRWGASQFRFPLSAVFLIASQLSFVFSKGLASLAKLGIKTKSANSDVHLQDAEESGALLSEKLKRKLRAASLFRNSYFNMAVPFMTMSTPELAPMIDVGTSDGFRGSGGEPAIATLWDSLPVSEDGSVSASAFASKVEDRLCRVGVGGPEGCEVELLSCEGIPIWSSLAELLRMHQEGEGEEEGTEGEEAEGREAVGVPSDAMGNGDGNEEEGAGGSLESEIDQALRLARGEATAQAETHDAEPQKDLEQMSNKHKRRKKKIVIDVSASDREAGEEIFVPPLRLSLVNKQHPKT